MSSTTSATVDATLNAVTFVGPLWSGDLLATLRDKPGDLTPTVAAKSYGLPKAADVEDTARASWTVLKAAWSEFSDLYADAVAANNGGADYGSDDFTRDTWTRHLLDQLGYHPEPTPSGGLVADDPQHDSDGNVLREDRYQITDLHNGQVPVHAVPAGTPLDRRTTGVQGAAHRSPHATAQEYLNRSGEHLWAVVTNGLTLRLVRDNAAMARKAYIEFDLAAVFDEGDYPTFALLWRTAHATRFTHEDDAPPTDCIAERWQTHTDKTGVAALDDLREGVEHALAELGHGLLNRRENGALRAALENSDDPFDAAAYYRELLYVVYQHVFWFVIDDRNLLHPGTVPTETVELYRTGYSSDVLRTKARRHRAGHQPDGWHHYRLVAGWFGTNTGQPALGLPALLGGLWDPKSTEHLHGTTLPNDTYYEAVRALAYVRRDKVLRRINYDVMGSEELGAVYEGLLENIPDVDVAARTFTLDKTAGNERKTTGSYYTPTSLINVLLDEALDPVVERATDDAKQQAETEGLGPSDVRARQVDAILGNPARDIRPLTVCDPAMGSAHFLVAAGWRIARRVAQLRTNEPDPPQTDIQQALRDVASRCLYGVDINPMAVELAKVAVWLETHVPGQPLTFLDHHFKVGNGLLGVGFDTSIMDYHVHTDDCSCTHPSSGNNINTGLEGGLTNDAFQWFGNDDKKTAQAMRKDADEHAAGRQSTLFAESGAPFDFDTAAHKAAAESLSIAWLDDSSPEALAAKQKAHMAYGHIDELERLRLRADAFVATWTMPKTEDVFESGTADMPYHVFYDTHYNGIPGDERNGVRLARKQAAEHRFFHWPVEYPEIAAADGFDVMLGNPPWERIKLQTEEWFAAKGRADIADASRASVRNKLIKALRNSDDPQEVSLAEEWEQAQITVARQSEFIRNSGRFPLGGVGDINTYAVFADHMLESHNEHGAAGLICPSGLATGKTYAPFFSLLVEHGRLRSFYGFENEAKVFPEVHNETKFALVTFHHGSVSDPINFTGYARTADDLNDADQRYTLTADDIRAINPNTLTAPLFRRSKAAETLATIHRDLPVLIEHGLGASDLDHDPWNVTYMSMFHMANDSGLFRTADEVTGIVLAVSEAMGPDGPVRPLYEGKMFWQWDHRYGTYDGQTQKQANKGVLPHTTAEQKSDPHFRATPRYWVDAGEVEKELAAKEWDRDWLFAFRDVGPKERTFIPSVVPRVAAGDKAPLLLPQGPLSLFAAMCSSFVVDYSLRQKTSTSMKLYVVEQAPVLRPTIAADPCPWSPDLTVEQFVSPRVAELTYTASDLSGWADDIGYGGEPFRWDEERRPVLQAELDAAMFHLYRLARDQVEFVLDSFKVLRKYEEKPPEKDGLGEFRTKQLVLERYDAMSKAASDVVAYECPLDVPPADDTMRHDPA